MFCLYHFVSCLSMPQTVYPMSPIDAQYHEIYAIVRSRILYINKHHIHIYIYNDYGIYIFIDVWKPHIAQFLRWDQLEFAAGAAPSIDFRIGFLVITSS